MLQQRKKDYLQRLIEEISRKLQLLIDENRQVDDAEKQQLLDDCFQFFITNFDIYDTDDFESFIKKIDDFALLEQYARLIMAKYDMAEFKDRESLKKALSIIEYTEAMDTTYSWERTVLREDILNRLDSGI